MSDDPTPERRPRVAVVFGGRSGEHSISCISAGSVIAALDPERYDVVPVGIATDGRWVLESAEPGHLALGAHGELPSVTGDREVALTPGQGLVVTEPGDVPHVLGEVDVVFPVMHGPWGQDGTLQGLLEMAGVRYVGAGVLSSAVGTDKHFMKQLFLAAGLPVLPYVLVRPGAWDRDPAAIREAVAVAGLPGLRQARPRRLEHGHQPGRRRPTTSTRRSRRPSRHDPKVLVEAARRGRPRGRDRRAPGPRRRPARDQRARRDHAGRGARVLRLRGEVPRGELPRSRPTSTDATAARVRELAVQAFEALDVEGLARVDFFVLPDGRVVVNEVETMPGFTATSMFPLLWQASGLSYPELVERLVRLAMERETGLRLGGGGFTS